MILTASQTAASKQAYLAILPRLSKRRLEVYEAALAREPHGVTLGELSVALAAADGTKRSYHLLSPRVSELVERGWLVETPERRDGMTVYRVGDGSTPKARSRRARSKPMTAKVVSVTPDPEDAAVSVVLVRVATLGLLAAPMVAGTPVVVLVPRA